MKRTIGALASAVAVCAPAFAEYVAQGDFTIGANVAAEVGTYDSTTYTVTLADDVTVGGTLTIADGVTIDLAGYKLTAAAFESANLVVNGDFETDPMTLDGSAVYAISDWKYLAANGTKGEVDSSGIQTYVADWTWVGWSNPYHGAGLCKPGSTFANSALSVDKKYAAFIHGTGSSGRYLAQELPAVSAGVYKWSFKYASRSSYPNWGFKFDFLLEKGGVSTKLGNTISPTAASPWETPSGTVTIDEAGAYTLKFKINSASKNSDNLGGAVFDNVVLKKVSVVTDSGTGTPGELHITGENGAAALNGDISVGGNLKVVLHEMTIDGDLTANVDTVLAGDVTVNGTLALEPGATIDLAGNELTAQGVAGDYPTYKNGDITQPTGTITDCGNLYNNDYSGATLFNDTYFNAQTGKFTWKGDQYHRALMDKVSATNPFWVKYDFGAGVRRKITSYKVWCGFANGYQTRGPKDWVLQGSNTGNDGDWKPVDSRSGITWANVNPQNNSSCDAASKSYTCAYPGAYRYYRFQCTASSTTMLEITQLEYFGSAESAITDTSAGTPGKLRLAVPEGTTLTNSKVAISGNLDFVKDGEGTFTCATEGLMSYLGDTYIEGGTFLCGLNGSKHPFGGKNLVVNGDFETEPLKLDGSGVYSISANSYSYYGSGGGSTAQFYWEGWVNSSGGGLARPGSYFVASGQSVGNYAAFIHTNPSSGKGRNIYQDLFLAAGKYKWSFRYAKRPNKEESAYDFNLIQNSTSTTTKLKSLTPSSSDFDSASGTVEVSEAGLYRLQFIATNQGDFGAAFDDVVFERIDKEVHIATGATLDLNGKSGFGNYKFVGEGGAIVNTGANISENLVVSGEFAPVATTGSFGVVLQDGATLDLANWTGSFPGASSAPAVSFASGAEIAVNLADREDLYTIAKGSDPYVLKWSSQPGATFTIDSDSRSHHYQIVKDSTGLKLVRYNGLLLIVK